MDFFTENPKIIIVDDEKMITQSIKTLIMLEYGFSSITFNCPVEALEYLKHNEADLVISDFVMPKLNGLEFLKEAKKTHKDATYILLTGYADKENAIKAINEVGIYRYLEKPWDNEDFLLSIKTGLERSHLVERLESLVKARTEELNYTNTKLKAILNSCADGIITTNQKGEISSYNPSFEMLLNKKDIKNENILSLFETEKPEEIIKSLTNSANSIIRDCYTITQQTPVELNIAPIIQNEQKDEYVISIRDITIQKENERLRDDFIATLAHDLRTPLQAAIQTLKFFIDRSLGDISEKQEKYLSVMLSSNEDMLYLVNSLLEVYRYESGQLYLNKSNHLISKLVDSCVKEIETLLNKKSIELRIIQHEDAEVFIDRAELKRVLANIIGNAVKFTQNNGKITIKVDILKTEVKITVQDNGPGIPKEDLPKMFKRFSQGTNIKRSTGTGLGLFLSRQIIEAHGGEVFVESEIGKGSLFGFSIPK